MYATPIFLGALDASSDSMYIVELTTPLLPKFIPWQNAMQSCFCPSGPKNCITCPEDLLGAFSIHGYACRRATSCTVTDATVM